MALPGKNFGLATVMSAINENATLEEANDVFSLMEEVSDDTVKQLALDRSTAEVAEDEIKSAADISAFIKTIPESNDDDDAYTKEEVTASVIENLSVLTEQLELKGVV